MGAWRGLVLHTTLCCLASADLIDFGTRLVLEKLSGKEDIEVTPDDTKAVSDVLRWWFGTGEYAKGTAQPAHELLGAPEGNDQYTDLGHQLLVEWLSNVVNRNDALQYAEALAALGVDRFADLYELEEPDWPDVMREKKLHLGKIRRAVEAQRQQEATQMQEEETRRQEEETRRQEEETRRQQEEKQVAEQEQREEERRKEAEAKLHMKVTQLRSSDDFVASGDEFEWMQTIKQLDDTIKQAIEADVPQALVKKANDELEKAKEAYKRVSDEREAAKAGGWKFSLFLLFATLFLFGIAGIGYNRYKKLYGKSHLP